MTTKTFLSVILLAGGQGTRMGASIPKQFLRLKDKTIAHYSFEIFMGMPEVSEVVVVCDPQHRHEFPHLNPSKGLSFALPGIRRQDSVYSGLQVLHPESTMVCVHDAARPLVTQEIIARAIQAAEEHGAAVVGMPIKFTVKQTNEKGFVHHTPDRAAIWEIQTPQVMRRHLIEQGFLEAIKRNLTVTDDVSLVELLQHPVKTVEGSYTNMKITTLEDLAIAESLLEQLTRR